ncbi:MAG: sulfatase-like hydrolase/transferase [Verrucomicrobia bacterium]|nr:sulfatase-like hydrolase/transferase [Verrucomicrobiota bacterium]MCH8526184.1 sulfatase-like hydrolase/transferase [Kiritimatiellia bacterium]
MKSSPNVLILMTDQHRWDYLSCVIPGVPTPNLDRLAARGARFSEAVCSCPMCIPSRYSAFTGLYPSQLGVRNNSQTIQNPSESPVPTLFERLQGAGYHTIGAGKTHWTLPGGEFSGLQAPAPSTRGFERRFIGRMPGGHDSEPGALHYGDAAEYPQRMLEIREWNVECGWGGEGVEGYRGRTLPGDGSDLREAWLTDKMLQALDEAPADRPWLGYLSFDAPHAPLFAPGAWMEKIDPGALPLPDLSALADEDHFPPLRHTLEAARAWAAMPEREQRLSLARYAALCAYSDHQFGRVLDWLDQSGQRENTVVVFLSDHGESLGDRGRFSKYSLYEESVRVPLILAGPGVPEGQVDVRPANLIDLVPTLLQVCGGDCPAELPGESLLRPPVRKGAFAEMHGNGMSPQPAPLWMWRTPEWKLVTGGRGSWRDQREQRHPPVRELYHLATDPGERINRYADPACAGIRGELQEALLDHLQSTLAVWPRRDGAPVD